MAVACCDGPLSMGAELPWFALHVRSGAEKTVAAMLRSMGYEEFLPLYRSRRRWSDRLKDVELPLFAGYVFSRFDPQNRLPILKVPGLIHVVSFGRIPARLEGAEIAAIQAIIASGLPSQPWPFVGVGDRIVIDEGPLRGIEGVIVEVRNRYRLVASVTMLQRSVAVEVDREWIRPIPSAPVRRPMQFGCSICVGRWDLGGCFKRRAGELGRVMTGA
jgi:transcription antitermination factor NusG